MWCFEACSWRNTNYVFGNTTTCLSWGPNWLRRVAREGFVYDIKWTLSVFLSTPPDIRHPEELSLLRKPRDPKKKKKKLEEAEEDDLELEGPLLTPGSGELMNDNAHVEILPQYQKSSHMPSKQ